MTISGISQGISSKDFYDKVNRSTPISIKPYEGWILDEDPPSQDRSYALSDVTEQLSPEGVALFKKEMRVAPGIGCENAHLVSMPKNLKQQENSHAAHFQATKKWRVKRQ